MDFSAQFDNLQKRVVEAKAAAQTAATESRDQLKQRIDQAQDDLDRAAQDTKQQGSQVADEARGKWAQMKADADARRDDVKAKIDQRTRELDAKTAASDAGWAEADAVDALDYAAWSASTRGWPCSTRSTPAPTPTSRPSGRQANEARRRIVEGDQPARTPRTAEQASADGRHPSVERFDPIDPASGHPPDRRAGDVADLVVVSDPRRRVGLVRHVCAVLPGGQSDRGRCAGGRGLPVRRRQSAHRGWPGRDLWRPLYIVAGILAIAAGIMTFVWPDITLYVVSILVAWFLIVFGIMHLVGALAAPRCHGRWDPAPVGDRRAGSWACGPSAPGSGRC